MLLSMAVNQLLVVADEARRVLGDGITATVGAEIRLCGDSMQ